MRIPIILITGLLLSFLVTGCHSTKRFKSASYKGEDHQLVDMALFGTRLDKDIPEDRGNSLWDLSASAQTQLIQILHERYPDNAAFIAAMNRSYRPDGEGPVLDFTRTDLQMVFSIARTGDHSLLGDPGGKFSPADRIESLQFSLALSPETALSFEGWNRYATEYGEIRIAETTFSTSMEMEGQVSGELAEGSVGHAASRTEKQEIRSRYMKLSGSISDHLLEIRQQGTRECDLEGNVLADVQLAFEAFPEKLCIPLYGEGQGTDLLPVELSFLDVVVPRMEELPESISASLEFEYVYRHVKSGWKSYQEWDDRVVYYKGRKQKEVILFEKADIQPGFYCIGNERGYAENQQGHRLRVRTPGGAEYPLYFFNLEEARRFFNLLAAAARRVHADADLPVTAGSHTLLFGSDVLSWSMLVSGPDLKVMPVY